ncbi:MAG TPA: choice-of-anchor tandem repeat GloVer-containing protein [Terriglobia bacterium]|nr:choice-of-anchor tandem repeat GloVer-containing protein [Terriglobia bacterium]
MDKLNWGTMACAVFVLCVATAMALSAQSFKTLHSFDGTDGALPYAALVQATDGNFYGTMPYGGANGQGTVFKITPTGTLTTLYSFCSLSTCTDGAIPYGALVQATDGNFYGPTYSGGGNNVCSGSGCGTIFKITPSGTLTTLYSFCVVGYSCPDGEAPQGGLVQAANGNFYGTTVEGGTDGDGTIFKITPSGTLTTLYSFCSQSGCTDGAFPYARLVQATDGNFYGTTFGGGANSSCSPNGCGTIFKITPSGTLTTLHSFDSTDGAFPYAGLVQATDGNFYGSAEGGANGACSPFGCGTVFKITPSGMLTTLHSFDGTDGASPNALVQAADGNFYSTTASGGANNSCSGGCGTIFKITPSGTLTTLYSFCSQSGCTDGDVPFAGLVQATDGNLYGTTEDGGTRNYGTVFRLDVGLGPVVSLSPTSLNFGPQGVQAPNVPQVVTLTNTGEMPLSITGIAVTGLNSGDFAQANNCPIAPNTLAPGDNCRITVYFFPVGSGTLAAAVTVTDNAPGSPQNVSLSGVGVSGKSGLAGPRR